MLKNFPRFAATAGVVALSATALVACNESGGGQSGSSEGGSGESNAASLDLSGNLVGEEIGRAHV